MEAYFDNAATTRVSDGVRDIMIKVMQEDYGNPSSLHMKGVEAGRHIRTAAETISGILKCQQKNIIFTSGGTESNNLAIFGAASAYARRGKKIITSAIEHASVMSAMEYLKEQGFEIVYIGTDENGMVDIDELKRQVDKDTILVSIMYVNNETGSVQNIEEISRIIKEKNPETIFHVDAIQAFGKYQIYPGRIGVDMMSVSGHKLHGPKGSGFLYVADGVRIKPLIYGGGQQKGMRSGTENVPAIAGLSVAVKEEYSHLPEKVAHLYELKNHLIEAVTAYPDVYDGSGDAPHIASISFVGVRSEVMLHALEENGIYVSAGSACSSNKPHVSNVLKAAGMSPERLESTLRFSFAEENTMEQVDYAISKIGELLPVLRKYTRKK